MAKTVAIVVTVIVIIVAVVVTSLIIIGICYLCYRKHPKSQGKHRRINASRNYSFIIYVVLDTVYHIEKPDSKEDSVNSQLVLADDHKVSIPSESAELHKQVLV